MKLRWWHLALVICAFVALLSPLASASPDGLEWVAEEKGFQETAREPLYRVIADYVFPGVRNEAAATILAGVMGTLLLFALVYGLAWALRLARRRAP